MKLLVSAASRHGSTTEIADALARVVRERHGIDVDVRAPDDVRDVRGYDGIVIGSAVYVGKWLKPARSLVRRLEGRVTGLPVWLFSSGPTGTSDPGEHADVSDLMTRSGARDHRVFAGRLTTDALGPVERLMIRAVKAPTGDFRDWEAVGRWADGIGEVLAGTGGVRPEAVALADDLGQE